MTTNRAKSYHEILAERDGASEIKETPKQQAAFDALFGSDNGGEEASTPDNRIPLSVTQDMHKSLKALGFSDDDIHHMRPEDAWERLGGMPEQEPEAIQELRKSCRWVGGNYPDKIPLNPHTGGNASSTNSKTWGTYEQAIEAQKRYDWDLIGVALDHDTIPLVGIDLDHCASYGKVEPWAQEIITQLDSYAEYSPSYDKTPEDHGVRIFCKGDIPKAIAAYKDDSNKWATDDDLALPGVPLPPRCPEVYKAGRWLTVTGLHIAGTPTAIETRTSEILDLHTRIVEAQEQHKETVRRAKGSTGPTLASTQQNGDRVGDNYSANGGDPTATLTKHGWTVHREAGDKIYYTRPGKKASNGQSANWHIKKRVFCNFSGNSSVFEVGKGYSLFQVYALLEHSGDFKAAAKSLAAQGYGTMQQSNGKATTQSGSLPVFNGTDLGNARRLVHYHGQDLRYCEKFRGWHVWSGRHWELDEKGAIQRLVRRCLPLINAEAATMKDANRRKRQEAWFSQSEASARLAATPQVAMDEPGIKVLTSAFDVDPWLLNVQNGTLDLRTGDLRPHERTDLLRKVTTVGYDPDATCPQWLKFLEEILPDSEVRAFVQRAAGYSLTGTVRDRCLFFAHGGGNNGKSTFVETIMAMMGDYAQKAPTDMVMWKRNSGIPNDVARLPGARFVVVAEVEEGSWLAESKVKDLTGNDTLTARFLKKEFFDFRPTHKLWMYGNHKPIVRGTDDAIWQRIKLIPFTVQIPNNEIDEKLPEKLLTELPGVLAWAVRGCLKWQENGLDIPEAVTGATKKYRAGQDEIGRFLTEYCVVKAGARAKKGELFNLYSTWGGELKKRRFGNKMRELGYTDERGIGNVAEWGGIGFGATALPPIAGN